MCVRVHILDPHVLSTGLAVTDNLTIFVITNLF